MSGASKGLSKSQDDLDAEHILETVMARKHYTAITREELVDCLARVSRGERLEGNKGTER